MDIWKFRPPWTETPTANTPVFCFVCFSSLCSHDNSFCTHDNCIYSNTVCRCDDKGFKNLEIFVLGTLKVLEKSLKTCTQLSEINQMELDVMYCEAEEWNRVEHSVLVSFPREHHEGFVSSSSWDGETGHPSHQGNTPNLRQVFIYRCTCHRRIHRFILCVFAVDQHSAETSRRPLWDPRHETKPRHSGDPQRSVRSWRPIGRRPASCERRYEEQAANQESRGGSGSPRLLRASP